jgi:hypothetical integral membrane protein (TIGR02206 family)
VSSPSYDLGVALAGLLCAALCVGARRWPGKWTRAALGVLGLALLAQSLVCDMTDLVAVAACWWRRQLAIELTYFWGLAGTLQGILTPNLGTSFPHLEFFEYQVEHLGIVVAALFLVVGLRLVPQPGAVVRIVAITAGYTAAVGAVDALTGADYMFLRSPPATWSVLQGLGPWPWYILSATGVAVVFVAILDVPFWMGRRRDSGSRHPDGPAVRGAPSVSGWAASRRAR